MKFPLAVRAVMIDLDGTLLDTALDLTDAANAMLREFALAEYDVETIRTFIGRGLPNLVQRCLDGRAATAPPHPLALASFRSHYREINGRHATLYPGVVEGLRTLRAKGLPLACVTNKASDFTLPLLERIGLAGYFEQVVCGDTLPRNKPDPLPLLHICEHFGIAPHQALLIGDSLNDVTAARAAGCPVFCVPYGYNEGRPVQELDCDAIVSTLEAAAALVIAEQRDVEPIHQECSA
jgi:phosphoglycolate phosphatase